MTLNYSINLEKLDQNFLSLCHDIGSMHVKYVITK